VRIKYGYAKALKTFRETVSKLRFQIQGKIREREREDNKSDTQLYSFFSQRNNALNNQPAKQLNNALNNQPAKQLNNALNNQPAKQHNNALNNQPAKQLNNALNNQPAKQLNTTTQQFDGNSPSFVTP
jgi:hypothetical protein